MTGMIFDIQKFSIHDGPGIRTTVFLKGCPLRCRWCHNPESNTREPQLSFLPDRCIGCGFCFERCPQHAHKMVDGRHVIDRDACVVCGACTEKCYAEALEMVGREATVEEVIDEVMKDKPFYDTSGGGMTVSGGEPLMQADFTLALLRAAKERSLHCCIETSGYAPFEIIDSLRPYIDIFLYDVKETDDARHKILTGVGCRRIQDNLKRLHDLGEKIVIRLPMVPGCNDTAEHFQGLAKLARELPNVQGFEIMPYHRLGEGKLERMGMPTEGRISAEAPEPELQKDWLCKLRELGVPLLNEDPS